MAAMVDVRRSRLTSLMVFAVKSAPFTVRDTGAAPNGVVWGDSRSLGSGRARRGDGLVRQVAMRGPLRAASARKPLSGSASQPATLQVSKTTRSGRSDSRDLPSSAGSVANREAEVSAS